MGAKDDEEYMDALEAEKKSQELEPLKRAAFKGYEGEIWEGMVQEQLAGLKDCVAVLRKVYEYCLRTGHGLPDKLAQEVEATITAYDPLNKSNEGIEPWSMRLINKSGCNLKQDME